MLRRANQEHATKNILNTLNLENLECASYDIFNSCNSDDVLYSLFNKIHKKKTIACVKNTVGDQIYLAVCKICGLSTTEEKVKYTVWGIKKICLL